MSINEVKQRVINGIEDACGFVWEFGKILIPMACIAGMLLAGIQGLIWCGVVQSPREEMKARVEKRLGEGYVAELPSKPISVARDWSGIITVACEDGSVWTQDSSTGLWRNEARAARENARAVR